MWKMPHSDTVTTYAGIAVSTIMIAGLLWLAVLFVIDGPPANCHTFDGEPINCPRLD